MTTCGHNYCQQCLAGMERIPWICPECRTEQRKRPEQLPRNFFLERTVQKFEESRNNNDEYSEQERNAMLMQLDQLKQQLAQVPKIAAEAEKMKIELFDQKKLFDDMRVGFQHVLDEEYEKNKKVNEANSILLTRQKSLEGQLEGKETACRKLELENTSLNEKLNQSEKDQVEANKKLMMTQRERTSLEQRIKGLELSLKDLLQHQQVQIQELAKQELAKQELAKQQKIVAEAEETKRLLDDEKIQLENMCQEWGCSRCIEILRRIYADADEIKVFSLKKSWLSIPFSFSLNFVGIYMTAVLN